MATDTSSTSLTATEKVAASGAALLAAAFAVALVWSIVQAVLGVGHLVTRTPMSEWQGNCLALWVVGLATALAVACINTRARRDG